MEGPVSKDRILGHTRLYQTDSFPRVFQIVMLTSP